MKYALTVFFLFCAAAMGADTPPVITEANGIVTITLKVDMTTDKAGAKGRIAALPAKDQPAKLAEETIMLNKTALARAQGILARAEAATGMSDKDVEAELTKVTNEFVKRAADLKAARASGVIDPNN